MSFANNIIQRGRFAVSPDTLTNETPGGTTIQSSLPYVADMDQFKVTVQKDGDKWRLRVNKGVVFFQDMTFDQSARDFSGGLAGKVITDYNIFPTGKKTTGTAGDQSQGVEQDGNIEIESGSNYYVFVYSITPEWTGAPTDANNPQLVVCKEGDDPNAIFTNWECGGGYISPYLQQTIVNYDIETPTGTVALRTEQNVIDQVYAQVDCARHSIAHVIWDATKGWQVRQLQLGPFVLSNKPLPGACINFQTIDGVPQGGEWEWDPAAFTPYANSQASITGYTRNLTSTGYFGLSSSAPTGTRFLKPT